jgi:hypothetical protein
MAEEIGVLIATHSHGYVTPAFAQSLWKAGAALAAQGLKHYAMIFEDSLVDRGRDRAAAAFLASDFTHLLFIDADTEFEPEAILALLAADKPLIAGAYRKKNERNEFAIAFLEDCHETLHQCPEAGAIKIARAGTGFMMIKREVFEKIAAAHPEIAYTDNSHRDGSRAMHAFFEHLVRDGLRWSEDFTFCERWRNLGGDVWLHPFVEFGHWGPACWRGSITDLLHGSEPMPTSSAA